MASNYDKHIFRQLEDVLKKCDNLSQEIKDIKKEHKEEIKRLKKLNKNTIRMQVNFDGRYYEVDTQIPAKLKEMNYYYLADDYKNPSKVKFMNYEIAPSIDNKIIICARVLDEEKDEFMFYFSEKLFESKSRASDFYLANRSK